MKYISCVVLTFFLFMPTTHVAHANNDPFEDVSSFEAGYAEERLPTAEGHHSDLRPPRGCPGPNGPTGPTGPAGFTGADGLKGPTGPQGLPGIMGFEGNMGGSGATGSTGPRSGLSEYAYFSKTNSNDVDPASPIDFNYASPLNTSNIVYNPVLRRFLIGTGGTYYISYIVTPIGNSTPKAVGFAFLGPANIADSVYKIGPENPTPEVLTIPVMRGQCIQFFPAGTIVSFQNLTLTTMSFDSDAGFGAFASANVASIVFIRISD